MLAPTLQDASKDIVRSLRLLPTRASNYYANCLSRDVRIVAESHNENGGVKFLQACLWMRTIVREKEQWEAGISLNLDYVRNKAVLFTKVENI